MNIALVQLNMIVGDLIGNRDQIIDSIQRSRSQNAQIVVLSELAICGYPPRDLLGVDRFVEQCESITQSIGEEHTQGITLIIGTPRRSEDGHGIKNSLVVYQNNKELSSYDKRLLPTYDVFDEDRYFEPGNKPCVFEVANRKIGLAICEDLWRGEDSGFVQRYTQSLNPVDELIEQGAELIIAPSASPYALDKDSKHLKILSDNAKTHQVPVLSVNQVGANDDLIFSGQSSAVNSSGELCAQARAFENDMIIVDPFTMEPINVPMIDQERMIIDALTMGTHDYVTKCGFKKVCLGLSGGIDSALVAALGARALGSEQIIGVSMPGRFSSESSKSDAFDLATNLGMRCLSMPIESGFQGVAASINPAFTQIDQPTLGESLPDLTQENLQSRIRGTMMMAFSNRTGALVLTTGNKSEIAVGYCTLYGDMNGGLAVIADLPKTLVFRVCRYMNEHFESLGFPNPPIPINTIEKPPSAELAPNQLDSDSLPDYPILDEIVERHIEKQQSADRIIQETKFEPQIVHRICKLIDRNEYKRQQMATGLRITSKAFGRGRRMPIAQQWVR